MPSISIRRSWEVFQRAHSRERLARALPSTPITAPDPFVDKDPFVAKHMFFGLQDRDCRAGELGRPGRPGTRGGASRFRVKSGLRLAGSVRILAWYGASDIRPVPDVAAELWVVFQVSVLRERSATAKQIASGPEWGIGLSDVARMSVRYAGRVGLRLGEAVSLFATTLEAVQGREPSGSWWSRLVAGVGDGPHAVVTMHADFVVALAPGSADEDQVSRLGAVFAEPCRLAVAAAYQIATGPGCSPRRLRSRSAEAHT